LNRFEFEVRWFIPLIALLVGTLVVVVAFTGAGEDDGARERSTLEQRFDRYVAAMGTLRTKVTYKLDPPVEGTSFDSLFYVVYTSGTVGHFRIDQLTPDQQLTEQFLIQRNQTLYCSSDATYVLGEDVSSGAAGACTYDPPSLSTLTITDLAFGIDPDVGMDIVSATRETIGGVQVDCFRSEGYVDIVVDYCFDQDSRLMLVRRETGDREVYDYVAASFESVNDSDFDPPYTIVDSD
jgi:hypothetical protein